ncbi:MAG: hypothetical protein AB1Z98_33610 [Nannocystaceae bacterium]
MPYRSELPEIVRRDIDSFDLALLLRGAVGLPLRESARGEAAASVGREIPAVVPGVDIGGWIAWALAGLVVFAAGEQARPPAEPAEPAEQDEPTIQPSRPSHEARVRRLLALVPDRRVATREALRLVAALAMMRTDGNISQAAAALETSRRATREVLENAGLYPWSGRVRELGRR